MTRALYLLAVDSIASFICFAADVPVWKLVARRVDIVHPVGFVVLAALLDSICHARML